MEFDGFVDYRVAVTARRDVAVTDIRLEVPYSEGSARYMMGLGFKGGARPGTFEWTWDQIKNQDALWLGSVNAGMQVGLRAENYSRPLNTNFYLSKPLAMPPSWWNEGRGRVTVGPAAPGAGKGEAKAPAVVMTASSGPRSLRTGETLHFDFTLLLTPFKPIEPAAHFRERYFHAFEPLEEVAAAGANVVNVHHANAVNPYINYPFLRVPRDEGLRRRRPPPRVSRSRSTTPSASSPTTPPRSSPSAAWATRSTRRARAAAIPGSRSTSGATTSRPGSCPSSRTPRSSTAACRAGTITTSRGSTGSPGTSRSTVSTSTTSPSTARSSSACARSSTGTGPAALIDLHCANQYNSGRLASAPTSIWSSSPTSTGSGSARTSTTTDPPDFWLSEVSGIPFGLMGEMLQDGGNPWRGMRLRNDAPAAVGGDPRPLWKVWDEFGIARKRGWSAGGSTRSPSGRQPGRSRDLLRRERQGRNDDRSGFMGERTGRRPPGRRLEEARPRPEDGRSPRSGYR